MGWLVNDTPRPLHRRETVPVPIVQETEWAPRPVSTVAKNLALPNGSRSPDRRDCSESLYGHAACAPTCRRWRSWLRHCATSRREQVPFPKVSLEFFIDNPSGRIRALGLTNPLTEISTRNICCGVKAAGAKG